MKHTLSIVLTGLFLCSTMTGQNFIRVNQIGYYTESPKKAIFANMDAAHFEIKSVENDEEVYRGKLSDGKRWKESGEIVQVADFSDYKIPGKYYIKSGSEKSYPFEIADDYLFDSLSVWTLKAFYLWRASIDIDSQYAAFGNENYARKMGHPDDNVLVHSSVATPARPEKKTRLSAPKGWYDAGDYNKYVVNAGITVHSLGLAYEMFPDYYKRLRLNIPESGNGVPDIVNELKWEYDWLFDMQDPNDGGVYNKLTTLRFSDMVLPEYDKADRYMVGKSTTAALDFAAIMAMGARIFKEYETFFPGYAARALHAAEKAWEWAQVNNKISFKNPPDVRTGGYGDDDFDDEFFWAASELFITTGNRKYYEKLDFFQKFETPTWNLVNSLGLMSLQVHADKLPVFADKEQIEKKFKGLAENIYNQYRFSPNLVPIRKFEWGSNGYISSNGTLLGIAYYTLKDNKYLPAMVSCLDYLLGTNPTEYCFVTRFGSKYPKHVHDRRAEADGIKEPIPGYLAGGANPNQVSDCGRDNYLSVMPARCYLDDLCSYSTNEIAINWNAPFVLLVGMVENAFNKIVK
jgi:endoglucanase